MRRRFSKKDSDGWAAVVLAVFLLFCVGYLMITNAKLIKKKNALEYQFKEISQKKQEAQIKNESLKAEVSQINNKDYQEEILREKAMYKKAGEGVIVVKDLQKQVVKENIENQEDDFLANIINKIKQLIQKK